MIFNSRIQDALPSSGSVSKVKENFKHYKFKSAIKLGVFAAFMHAVVLCVVFTTSDASAVQSVIELSTETEAKLPINVSRFLDALITLIVVFSVSLYYKNEHYINKDYSEFMSSKSAPEYLRNTLNYGSFFGVGFCVLLNLVEGAVSGLLYGLAFGFIYGVTYSTLIAINCSGDDHKVGYASFAAFISVVITALYGGFVGLWFAFGAAAMTLTALFVTIFGFRGSRLLYNWLLKD